jgi:hypothetical protein
MYWTAESQADLMVQILVATMVAPSAKWPFLGEKFDAWFFRSCHRDGAQRWRSSSEQISALVDVLRDAPRARDTSATGGASVVTVNRALHPSGGGSLAPGAIPAFGLPTPGSTAPIGRTPLGAEPRASSPSLRPATGIGTMAPATGTFDPAEAELLRPRSRKLAIGLSIGLVIGLALAYALVPPSTAPSIPASASPATATDRPGDPAPASTVVPKNMPFADPAAATVDGDAGRIDIPNFDTSPSRAAGRANSPGPRTAPSPNVKRPQRALPAAPAPNAPSPTAPPQDDPLAP